MGAPQEKPENLTGQPASPEVPSRLGRYQLRDCLGAGATAEVHLAFDEELERVVAVKVIHPRLLSSARQVASFQEEARTLARLDHPGIVPIYDVGQSDNGLCFIVSKYLDGGDLKSRLKEKGPDLEQAVEVVLAIADALHFAHQRGLVHRDVKPGNILFDQGGRPILADFGIALRAEDVGTGPVFVGTPGYMSPEQARREAHRVDARSDVYSLGAVFYELLVGQPPFTADTRDQLLEQVMHHEAVPVSQLNPDVPVELERICTKAMGKRAADRYSSALALAEDLRMWQARSCRREPGMAPPPRQVVPRGLRSFGREDADFFLDLLPGPRNRDGLPDNIAFWKTRFEATDPDQAFRVGVVFGPSGSGKSSLVKAGLLPRLSKDVIPVYIEATLEETEKRLLNGLRKRCPALDNQLGLKDTLAALRRGQDMPAGKKVVIVIDQFEQWLHARKEEENTELVQALRHCDGSRVQSVVMVRDDFWMATIRFMRELEVPLLESHNSAAVDLFPLRHAEKVLAAFGRAFGTLPDSPTPVNKEQEQFLEQAVAGLAQEGKVISVRLALLAEMMKGKSWTPAALQEVGGTEGVGVTFLEETFSATTAPAPHRYHQKAVRRVLQALLPESGTAIKGHMRSAAELLEASGYTTRANDFADLLHMLDSELRLVTPTDPEGKDDPDEPGGPRSPDARYYQLTHDYLVPSLRDWLTRKQKETKQGRAELLLADRATVWNARPENRQLPSLWQWCSIRWLTAKKNWTPPQHRMMRTAARYHAVRGLLVVVVLALLGWLGYEGHGRLQAHALRDRLLNADIADVPLIVKDMAGYRGWLDPLLHDADAQAQQDRDSRKQLHTSLALLPVDATQKDYLYGRLLDAEPNEVPVIRDALRPHSDTLLDKLWAVVEASEKGRESQRLRAAAALATYDPKSARWAKGSPLVVHDLVRENPVYLGQWSEAFRPVKDFLLEPLADIFRDQQPERAAERSLATNLLADYAAHNPQVLADLLMDADETQFAVIYPKLKERIEQSTPLLTGEIDKKLPSDLPSSDKQRDKLARRQANAAAVLLTMNQPAKVWPLLMRHDQPGKPDDPRVRSYLVHRLSSFGVDPRVIIQRLDEEPDITIRRALLLSLGEYGEKELSPATRQALLPQLQDIYRTEADPGLHAAAEWLLRQWQQHKWLQQTNEAWAKDKEQREKRLGGIQQRLAKEKDKTPPQWFVNTQGQTMIVIPGPVQFLMGSPATEAGRYDGEPQHQRRISRTFAIAAHSVTWEQYLQLAPQDKDQREEKFSPSLSCPANYVSWYMAANYCNWLSRKEGLTECYETDAKGQVTKLKAKYLSLSGYRMPTEAELEYAIRAGALTSRFYGETETLLPQYAWYLKNAQEKTWPVASRKPNDLGFFDLQGNVFAWCQEPYRAYPKNQSKEDPAEDEEIDVLTIDRQESRVLRGGSFGYQASFVRSANRNFNVPNYRNSDIGFRPARTLPPVPAR